jgi:glycosyltransferase involved in cell wall biosynthesis
VGVDKAVNVTPEDEKEPCDLLYLGALRKLRGFYAFQAIWPELVRQKPDVKIRVLARGDEPGKEEGVKAFCQRHGLTGNVEIISGWLDKEEIQQHIASCKAVVLPFILVPSDVPIAILEALAAGKPVIGGDVDGIPDMVRDNGIVVNPLDQKELASACIMCAAGNQKAGGDASGSSLNDWSKVGEVAENLVGEIE